MPCRIYKFSQFIRILPCTTIFRRCGHHPYILIRAHNLKPISIPLNPVFQLALPAVRHLKTCLYPRRIIKIHFQCFPSPWVPTGALVLTKHANQKPWLRYREKAGISRILPLFIIPPRIADMEDRLHMAPLTAQKIMILLSKLYILVNTFFNHCRIIVAAFLSL